MAYLSERQINLAFNNRAVWGIGACAILIFATVAEARLLTSFQSTRWPTESGTVDSAYVQNIGANNGNNVRVVRYRFSVDNKNYIGTTAVPFNGNNLDETTRIAAELPGKGSVTVYYDPRDPSTSSIVQPKVTTMIRLASLYGLFMVLGCFGLYYFLTWKPGSEAGKSKGS
jgi:Protein of unknown function (DUF3592)